MVERRTVYLIGASAPPVLQYAEACRTLDAEGWQPCVVLTPTAATWVAVDELARLTGFPARVTPRMPGEPDPFPPADAVLAAPLTFNTINKWAAGMTDNPALGLLCELMGAPEVPVLAVPCVKTELRHHPAYEPSLDRLRAAGVDFLAQEGIISRASDGLAAFDWKTIAAALVNGPPR